MVYTPPHTGSGRSLSFCLKDRCSGDATAHLKATALVTSTDPMTTASNVQHRSSRGCQLRIVLTVLSSWAFFPTLCSIYFFPVLWDGCKMWQFGKTHYWTFQQDGSWLRAQDEQNCNVHREEEQISCARDPLSKGTGDVNLNHEFIQV